MKHTLPILALFTLHASLFTLPAAVPLRWTVETSRAQVAQFEAYRGETLLLEATMKSYGSPLETPVQPSLYWQTNGMGAAWWTAPATASGNVLHATWSPTNDCGGTVYNCFIGGPNATYRAAFRLRMLPSPGFTPNHIPLPTVKAESDPVFSSWLATNEFSSAGVDTNTVLGLITSATNELEGVGTGRQIIRGSNQYGPWDITVSNASTAQMAQGDSDGRSIIDTYAEKREVKDLRDQVNSLGQHYNELDGSLENMADYVGSLAGTIGPHVVDTNNPHKVTAAQVGALPIIGGTLTGDLAVGEAFAGSRTLSIASDNGAAGITLQGGTSYGNGSILTIGGSSGSGATLYVNGGAMRGGHVIVGASTGGGGILEVQGSDASIKKDGKEVATESYVDAKVENAVLPTNPTFSNAVLSVGLNIDTDSVAVLNEIASTFGGFPIEGTATTVGGLLAALAAAAAWLKKNKVGSFASVGSASATVENGVAKLDDFFTESNSLLTATIDARLPYPLYAVTDETGLLKDRAINTTSLASVTVPENFTDLIVRASVASSLSVTMPDAIATKYGDTFPGDGGEYLVTITKTGASEAYVRTIKLEVANA